MRFFFFIFFLLPFFLTALETPPANDSLREKALNSKEAMFQLGNEYFYGTKKRPKNPVLAAHWYKKAAELNLPEAIFNYALCLEQGLGVERNRFEAYDWMTKAADFGLKSARFHVILADLYGISEDTVRKIPSRPPLPSYARTQLESLAEDHYPPAETLLADLLLKEKTPQANARALEILIRLEKTNTAPPEALRILADCYYDGVGVPVNTEEMLRLLRKASKSGDAEAIGKLAYCYEYGRGIAEDMKKAENLYRISAERGNAMSQFKFAEFTANGTISKQPDIHQALPWYQKAAEQGNPQALFRLGVFYLDGIGVEKNDQKAAEFFFQSARKGYARAQYNLACLYAAGAGNLIQDETAAVYWFTLAAKGGDAHAQRNLARRYFEGRGVTRSITNGEKWLLEAAKNGDIEALEQLRQRRVAIPANWQ